MAKAPRSPDRHGTTAAGPVVLIVPLLALVLGVLWARHGRRSAPGPRPAPPPATPLTVAGWTGAAPLGEGRIEARLFPLQGEAARAALDRERLGALLGRDLGPDSGGPWRLELTHLAAADSLALDPGPGLDLTAVSVVAVSVVDGAGARLEPAAPTPDGAGPVHPLLPLLSPPREPLAPGRTVVVVLWGSDPGEGARVEGLGVPLTLVPSATPATDLDAALARVDRGEAER